MSTRTNGKQGGTAIAEPHETQASSGIQQRSTRKPIGIYYEHPHWFDRLFAEMERRGTPYARIDAIEHWFDPATLGRDANVGLVFNRMSPSAWNRGHAHDIFYTLQYLAHLEAQGVRVVNGLKAFRTEISKAHQLILLEKLGLGYPRARVINHPSQAVEAAEGLRLPIVVKPNMGGSGAGVKKFNSLDELKAAAEAGQLAFGLDNTALVQEFIPARGGHITRVEVVGGKYLYAIKVHITGETFDLCPADICKTPQGQSLETGACVLDAAKNKLAVEGFDAPPQVREDVERIMAEAGVEVGGVEYIVDDRDGKALYYDVNALSNFVADGPRVIGFDPFVPLVDFLEREVRA